MAYFAGRVGDADDEHALEHSLGHQLAFVCTHHLLRGRLRGRDVVVRPT